MCYFCQFIAQVRSILLLLQIRESMAGECRMALVNMAVQHQSLKLHILLPRFPNSIVLSASKEFSIYHGQLASLKIRLLILFPNIQNRRSMLTFFDFSRYFRSSSVYVLSPSTVCCLFKCHPKLEGNNKVLNLHYLMQLIFK